MNISEIRGKSVDECKQLIADFKKSLFNIRFRQAAGEQVNLSQIRVIKKSIARILTYVNEQGTNK